VPGPQTLREIKFAILSTLRRMDPVYTRLRHYHITSIVGGQTPGYVERELRIEFEPAQRDLAYLAMEELKRSGHIERTYHSGTDPEGWVRMSQKGYDALETRMLDALDEALHVLSPALADKRQEAWAALKEGRRGDAANAGFELFSRALKHAAPDDVVRARPDFKPDTDANASGGVTRAQRARHLLEQLGQTDEERADAAASEVVAVSKILGEMKHRLGEEISHDEAENALELMEMALRRVLVGYD
jgi:hypothetical protein